MPDLDGLGAVKRNIRERTAGMTEEVSPGVVAHVMDKDVAVITSHVVAYFGVGGSKFRAPSNKELRALVKKFGSRRQA